MQFNMLLYGHIVDAGRRDQACPPLPLSVSFFCFLPAPLDGTPSLWAVWWLAEAAESVRTRASSTGFESKKKSDYEVQGLVWVYVLI